MIETSLKKDEIYSAHILLKSGYYVDPCRVDPSQVELLDNLV